ncbi:MAG: RNA polymerase sigma factor SigM, partial [Mycobacteriaceae bacterium]
RRTSYDAEDAADSLQEALLDAHRSAKNFREDAAVRSWLHRIVVNACLDRIRNSPHRMTVPVEDSHLSRVELLHNPVETRGVSMAIEAALLTLPINQRAAIIAVDIEGYSTTEAADLLGVPEGTVKSRCARARARLATQLSQFRQQGDQVSVAGN